MRAYMWASKGRIWHDFFEYLGDDFGADRS